MIIVPLIRWHKTDKKCVQCSDEKVPCSATKENDFITFVWTCAFWLVCVKTTAIYLIEIEVDITHLGMCIFAQIFINISAGGKGYGLSC